MNNLRSLFLLDPEVVFLNHGSFGATPRPVFDRITNIGNANSNASPFSSSSAN